jgi:hypothetical protein
MWNIRCYLENVNENRAGAALAKVSVIKGSHFPTISLEWNENSKMGVADQSV